MEIQERSLDKKYLVIMIILLILLLLSLWRLSNYEDFFFLGQTKNDAWDNLNTQLVEENCLDQAKRFATDEGYDELFVLNCGCVGLETKLLKSFDCDVNTIDVINPARKVIVHCYKLKNECTVASEKGFETYTFEELESVINE
ncbi:hypothetical protein KKB44_01705 [Candidatus Micrarchaeota archaeon]|nr:hypothetical protein [Candidatus Micrarchaeota archaeon]